MAQLTSPGAAPPSTHSARPGARAPKRSKKCLKTVFISWILGFLWFSLQPAKPWNTTESSVEAGSKSSVTRTDLHPQTSVWTQRCWEPPAETPECMPSTATRNEISRGKSTQFGGRSQPQAAIALLRALFSYCTSYGTSYSLTWVGPRFFLPTPQKPHGIPMDWILTLAHAFPIKTRPYAPLPSHPTRPLSSQTHPSGGRSGWILQGVQNEIPNCNCHLTFQTCLWFQKNS